MQSVFYRYSKEGWNIATKAECQDCMYEARFTSWIHQQAAEINIVEFDNAAARAVACIQIIKPIEIGE